MHRGPLAEIDLSAIARNLAIVRHLTGGKPVIAVVKADAYGHGAVAVSKRLAAEGVELLAVAFTGEAAVLREAGVTTPVLVLFDKDIAGVFDYGLIPVISDIRAARKYSAEARKRNRVLDIHLKVDTGMGRLGFHGEDVVSALREVNSLGHLSVRGLMSHFSEADSSDCSFTREQLMAFRKIGSAVVRSGYTQPLLYHMANSAAILSNPEAHLDAVRPGLMLYGSSPFENPPSSHPSLSPAMTVKTSILSLRRVPKGRGISYGRSFVTVKDSLIAVLPVGYADCYNRRLSNTADVLVRGKRAPVAGRVCMDLTMADVTEVDGVSEGDEVVLVGRQGSEEITAREIATRAGTVPYEIFTTLGSSSKRINI